MLSFDAVDLTGPNAIRRACLGKKSIKAPFRWALFSIMQIPRRKPSQQKQINIAVPVGSLRRLLASALLVGSPKCGFLGKTS